MRLQHTIFFFRTSLFLLLWGCQAKYMPGFNTLASGSLKQDGNNDCLPQGIYGSYIAGKPLNDSNYLLISVNVVKTGSYQFQTATVNGFSFAGSGRFTVTGLNQVMLKSAGQPDTTGTADFIIRFDTSICHLTITVNPLIGQSEYFLSGSPGSCQNARDSGILVTGIPADSSCILQVYTDVSKPGYYALTTDTVNGIYYHAAGIFSAIGMQQVTLKAGGIPVQGGSTSLHLKNSAGNCNLSVQVKNAVVPANNELFPLVTGSYRTYDNLYFTGDTILTTLQDSTRINGNLYKIITETQQGGTPSQSQYRRSDSVYLEYISCDKYTGSLKFSPQIMTDLPFLREYMNTGYSWYSDEFVGPASFGQKIYLRYLFTCLNADARVTINGQTFIHVCQVILKPQIRSAPTYPYNNTGETLECWYAKGIGLIYSKATTTASSSFTTAERQLRYWLVP
ncbi:MAG TPA: hypothetical protein VG842_09530 [Sediminibacterium sp.]|nr:hypothetical protein [Sediminibacterium sp.]